MKWHIRENAHIALTVVLALLAMTSVASAAWQGTSWIQSGEPILASKIVDNFRAVRYFTEVTPTDDNSGDRYMSTADGALFTGNVGIGTTTPDATLDVDGIIRAQTIRAERYCDRDGNDCHTASEIGSGGGGIGAISTYTLHGPSSGNRKTYASSAIGTHVFCALTMVVSRDDDHYNYFDDLNGGCWLTRSGNEWTLHAANYDYGDITYCEAMCF